MATDKVSSLSKTNRKRYAASVMAKTWKHVGCLKIWGVDMIDKVKIYLADICLSVYLGMTVFIGWDGGNILIQILLFFTCLYAITQHKGQLFSDIIIWGMCLKSCLILKSEKTNQNDISSNQSHLESQDASLCSEYLAMATDKVSSLSKTNRKRYAATLQLCNSATLKLCDHDLARA